MKQTYDRTRNLESLEKHVTQKQRYIEKLGGNLLEYQLSLQIDIARTNPHLEARCRSIQGLTAIGLAPSCRIHARFK